MTDAAVTPQAPDLDPAQIRDILRRVKDPEVGKDIVALGLVYSIDVAADCVVVEMTMTSQACPMGDMLLDEVRAVLSRTLPDNMPAEVRLVWEPPWNPSMMDEATKQHFGWTS